MRSLILTILAGTLVAHSIAAQAPPTPPSPQIEAILQYSLVDNVLEGQGPDFLAKVRAASSVTSGETWQRVEQVIEEEFALPRMRADVAQLMYAASLPVILEELLSLLQSGSIARVKEIQDDYEPPESLQEYAASLQTARPPQPRIELIAQLARVQGAGEFYLLLDESARESAHVVAETLGPVAAEYVPLDRARYDQAVQQGYQFAVVSFLHRYRPVDDALVEGAIREYESEAGRWYIETYSMALADAIRMAAARTRDRLQ